MKWGRVSWQFLQRCRTRCSHETWHTLRKRPERRAHPEIREPLRRQIEMHMLQLTCRSGRGAMSASKDDATHHLTAGRSGARGRSRRWRLITHSSAETMRRRL